MCKALENVSAEEWESHKAKLDQLSMRTTKWAGGLTVLSFFILFVLALGVSLIREMQVNGQNNSRALAVLRYTLQDDEKRMGTFSEIYRRDSDRRQEWMDDQNKFRMQMVEFAAETRHATTEMRGLIKELKDKE